MHYILITQKTFTFVLAYFGGLKSGEYIEVAQKLENIYRSYYGKCFETHAIWFVAAIWHR